MNRYADIGNISRSFYTYKDNSSDSSDSLKEYAEPFLSSHGDVLMMANLLYRNMKFVQHEYHHRVQR